MDLAKGKCKSCEGGVEPLSGEVIKSLLKRVPSWALKEGCLFKRFKFTDFSETMEFVNSMAEIAEREGHHPDFAVAYNILDVRLWTHSINGLSENDFIMAAKIDKIK